MASTWEIGRIDLLTDAYPDFLAHHIRKGSLNGLPHQPFDTTGDLELSVSPFLYRVTWCHPFR